MPPRCDAWGSCFLAPLSYTIAEQTVPLLLYHCYVLGLTILFNIKVHFTFTPWQIRMPENPLNFGTLLF